MFRLFATLLLIGVLLSGAGEICGLRLPLLDIPFSLSRNAHILHIDRFLWFGWFCVTIGIFAAIRLLSLPKGYQFFSPIARKRFQRFRSIRRGWYSFLLILIFCTAALMDQCLVGKRALFVEMNDRWYFPAFTQSVIPGSIFGLTGNAAQAEADYRLLHTHQGETDSPSRVIMPPIPYDPVGDVAPFPTEQLVQKDGILYRDGTPFNGQASRLYSQNGSDQHLRLRFRKGVPDGIAQGWDRHHNEVYSARYSNGKLLSERYTGSGSAQDFLSLTPENYNLIHYHPSPPLAGNHLLGTNSQGADILANLFGGLQINLKAVLIFLPIVYGIGLTIGMTMGYFGGRFDLFVQRCIEILAQIPFLFVIMILSDLVPTEFKGIFFTSGLLALFGWTGISYILRTSTMKEKARDYTAAARIMGASTPRVLLTHILPNQLAIIVTLIPFSIASIILSLTSLDYLGFGLPDTCPGWGRLINDGLANLSSPWIVASGFIALVSTLLLVTFTGEAVREAFDPQKFTFYK